MRKTHLDPDTEGARSRHREGENIRVVQKSADACQHLTLGCKQSEGKGCALESWGKHKTKTQKVRRKEKVPLFFTHIPVS